MRIVIASDHAGVELKRQLVDHLKSAYGCEINDIGTFSRDSVDYPDCAHKAALEILDGGAERGILICGSGIGMCMTANRHKGIRAAVLRDAFDAEMCRAHNDCNIACIGARVTDFEKARELIDIWYKTPFEGGRHLRRVVKIDV